MTMAARPHPLNVRRASDGAAADRKLRDLLARCRRDSSSSERSAILPDPVEPGHWEWQVVARCWPDGVAVVSLTAYDRVSGQIVRQASVERHCADAAALAALAVVLRIN